mmetsp:Transcript_121113/g.258576  ORF Transcript_121113/g.258576 Transcript_121113/m.258576 type:complete len:235 (-) Transcript_121113:435-1139(-)
MIRHKIQPLQVATTPQAGRKFRWPSSIDAAVGSFELPQGRAMWEDLLRQSSGALGAELIAGDDQLLEPGQVPETGSELLHGTRTQAAIGHVQLLQVDHARKGLPCQVFRSALPEVIERDDQPLEASELPEPRCQLLQTILVELAECEHELLEPCEVRQGGLGECPDSGRTELVAAQAQSFEVDQLPEDRRKSVQIGRTKAAICEVEIPQPEELGEALRCQDLGPVGTEGIVLQI